MTMNDLQGRVAASLHEHWKLFLIEGIILIVLGLIAIVVPPIATLAVAILVGWLFLISGILGLVTTFWMRHAPGFWWSLLSAVLGIAAGIVLLARPLTGVLSLTLVLVWMRQDAEERALPFWPYAVVTVALGVAGPLAYLIYRELHDARSTSPQRV